jgi:hypothetical protein
VCKVTPGRPTRGTECFKDSTTCSVDKVAEDFMGSICGPNNRGHLGNTAMESREARITDERRGEGRERERWETRTISG